MAISLLAALWSCTSDAPPTAAAVRQRDSLPVMTTWGVSKLISDSGVVRYKLIAERWDIYDLTNPPRQGRVVLGHGQTHSLFTLLHSRG